MAEEDRGVALACVCISIFVVLLTAFGGNPRTALWSVLPLGIAAWILRRS